MSETQPSHSAVENEPGGKATIAADDPPHADRSAEAEKEPSRAWYAEKAALLGGGVLLVLSNIATILRLFQDLSDAFGVVHSYLPAYLPFWSIATATAVIVLVGNALLARHIYVKFAAHQMTRHKIIAAMIIAVTVTAMLCVNLISWQKLRPDVHKAEAQLESELLEAQPAGSVSGFRLNIDDASTREDSWTTAQAVEALLSSDAASHRQSIRAGLNYLKSSKTPQGWIGNPDPHSAPFVRPEISCWAILAYLHSLRSTAIWNKDELPAVTELVSGYISELIGWQDRQTGAWSPVADQVEGHDRTYTTTMAVWALSEAYINPHLSSDLKSKIGIALDGGTDWLIQHYRPGYGWDENPSVHVGDGFPGLNFLTFFALKKVEKIDGHNQFRELQIYQELEADMLSRLRPVQITDQIEVPSTDLLIDGKPIWATFLAYPWSFALLSELRDDPSLSAANRRKVEEIASRQADSLSELPQYLEHTYTWKLAEHLAGISYIGICHPGERAFGAVPGC